MSLVEQIKTDSIAARKNPTEKLKASLLVTLHSEIVNVGKNKGNRLTTDDEAVSVVKKFASGCKEMIDVLAGQAYDARYGNAIQELAWLDSYLPKQLTEGELADAIDQIVASQSSVNMGSVMKQLKADLSGRYDGALASKLIKAKLG